MEIFDNITKTVKDDLTVTIEKGSSLSIAAACFSIYAYQVLKKQFDQIDELRFIFTSPAFVTEKAPKEKREFYIPRLNRERSLYGTEFEVKQVQGVDRLQGTEPLRYGCFQTWHLLPYRMAACGRVVSTVGWTQHGFGV